MQWPPQPGPGSKRMKPNGFVDAAIQHFPNVHVHRFEDHLELVHKRDVDGPEDVLGELRRLRYPRRRHPYDLGKDLAVQGLRWPGARPRRARRPPWGYRWCQSCGCPDLRVRRVEKYIPPDDETRRLEDGRQESIRRAGKGRRLQDDELAGTQASGDRLPGLAHIAQIRISVSVEGSGHTEDQNVWLGQALEVSGSRQRSGRHDGRPSAGRRDARYRTDRRRASRPS